MKINRFCTLFLFSFYSIIFSGIPDGVCVLVSEDECKPVETMIPGDQILTVLDDEANTDVILSCVTSVTRLITAELIGIVTDNAVFIVGPDQPIWISESCRYVPAAMLSSGLHSLDKDFNEIEIKEISNIPLDYPVATNYFDIEDNRNFFICADGGYTILAHNGFVIVPFVVFTLPKIITAVQVATVAVSATIAAVKTGVDIYDGYKREKRLEEISRFAKEQAEDAAAKAAEAAKAQGVAIQNILAKAKKGGTAPDFWISLFKKLGVTDPEEVQRKLKEVKEKFGVGGPGGDPNDPNDIFKILSDLIKCPSALEHIFRKSRGHLDGTHRTLSNVIRFLEVVKAENIAKQYPAVQGNKTLFTQLLKSGEQLWVEMIDGKLNNAGINPLPK